MKKTILALVISLITIASYSQVKQKEKTKLDWSKKTFTPKEKMNWDKPNEAQKPVQKSKSKI